jgi:hypothetical protein
MIPIDATPQIDELFGRLRGIDKLDPIRGWRNWPLSERNRMAIIAPRIEASPGPMLCGSDKVLAQSIALNISAHPKQRVTRLYGYCLKASLVDVTTAPGVVGSRPIVGVRSLEPMHQVGKISYSRASHDEVEVIVEYLV